MAHACALVGAALVRIFILNLLVASSLCVSVRIIINLFVASSLCVFYSLKPERPWLGPCAIYQTYVRACFTCLRWVDAESRCVLACVSIQHNKHTPLPPHHTTPHTTSGAAAREHARESSCSGSSSSSSRRPVLLPLPPRRHGALHRPLPLGRAGGGVARHWGPLGAERRAG